MLHFISVVFNRQVGDFNANRLSAYAVNIYLIKVSNRNSRKSYEICSKLTIKTLERCPLWYQSANQWTGFYMIRDVVLLSSLLPLNISHTFFWCFYFRLWTSKCYLGSVTSELTDQVSQSPYKLHEIIFGWRYIQGLIQAVLTAVYRFWVN